MLTLLYTRCTNRGAKLPATWLLAVYCCVAIYELQTYFAWRSAFFGLSVLAMGMTFRVNAALKGSTRCGWAALLFLLLSYSMPVLTLRYLVLVSAAFFVVEYFYGRIQWLTFITALLITPVIDYVVNVFSFPLRLWLTGIAGNILAAVNPAVTTSGNMIQLGQQAFTVDVACMGLQMMLTSLLCGVMLIAFYQRRYQKALPVIWGICVLLTIAGLNIIANLFRIILLVQFALPPGTPAHDGVGILSLLAYVVLPMIPGTRWLLQRYGKTVVVSSPPPPRRYAPVLQGVLLVGVIAAQVWLWHPAMTGNAMDSSVKTLPGYVRTNEDDHVIKQTTTDALLYVKPIRGFYFTDHQPMICWKGSGFEFSNAQERTIQGVKMYTATLQKGNDRLYTAWWYESSTCRSSSQLAWRWDALRNGSHYYLVNITVEKPALLEQKVRELLAARLIQ
ncbi:MAG: exosortase N [Chitinophaga sp.]|uniref:exosortase N n=1 Tax=Chitinophaga sp. TaxID=1869181 RepID=UPI001B251B5B|nr:exosortase N [Chitinophaga sp.]MBO9732732.1 exosortase N [Chitinophaga sp.]